MKTFNHIFTEMEKVTTKKDLVSIRTANLSEKNILFNCYLSFFLKDNINSNLLVVLENNKQCEEWFERLQNIKYIHQQINFEIGRIPEAMLWGHNRYLQNMEQRKQLFHCLGMLQNSVRKSIVVTTLSSLCQKVIHTKEYISNIYKIQDGLCIEQEDFTKKLMELGYQELDDELSPGSFNIRGAVVDLFPVGASKQCRLSFFADKVNFIQAMGQKKEKEDTQLIILPAYDLIFSNENKDKNKQKIHEILLKQDISTADHNAIFDSFNLELLNSDIEMLTTSLLDKKSSVCSYIGEKSVLYFPNSLQNCLLSSQGFFDDLDALFLNDRNSRKNTVEPKYHYFDLKKFIQKYYNMGPWKFQVFYLRSVIL